MIRERAATVCMCARAHVCLCEFGFWWYFRSSSRFWPLSCRFCYCCCCCCSLCHYFLCSSIHGLPIAPKSVSLPIVSLQIYYAIAFSCQPVCVCVCSCLSVCACCNNTRTVFSHCFYSDFVVCWCSMVLMSFTSCVTIFSSSMAVQLHAIQWLHHLIVSTAITHLSSILYALNLNNTLCCWSGAIKPIYRPIRTNGAV